jgi:hypothetical protein
LLVCQRAACILRERRHRRTLDAFCDHVLQLRLSNQSQVKWIVQWPRGAEMAIPAVATSAIALEKSGKVCDLIRQNKLLRLIAAPEQDNRKTSQYPDPGAFHKRGFSSDPD